MANTPNTAANADLIDGLVVPLDPMDELGCDSCQFSGFSARPRLLPL